jgi:transposase
LGLRRPTVLKWTQRFSQLRMAGLHDAPRSGPPRRYTPQTERRILAQLDESPPSGWGRWNGRLLAQALGDVSADQVWAVLRKHGIQLQRRRSWCLSTDLELPARRPISWACIWTRRWGGGAECGRKAGHSGAERAQGWLRLPNGQALKGFSHEYKWHGTTTLFAALEVLSGQVFTVHYHRRRRREFLHCMNGLVAAYPGLELHVIVDNLSTHKPKHDRWLAHHSNVHFHYTRTHASWLNQIECWFSILSCQALQGASFTSVEQLRQAIEHVVARAVTTNTI